MTRQSQTALIACVVLCLVTGAVCHVADAQTKDRENLKEPQYRVSKSNGLTRNAPAPVPPGTTGNEAIGEVLNPGSKPVLDNPEASGPPASGSPAVAEPQPQPESPAPPAPPAPPAVAPEDGPQAIFDRVLLDATAMLQHIRDDVDDYTCIFIKRENVKGKVVGPQYMQTKVRCRKMDGDNVVVPFAVYMKFIKPANLKGREVMYVEGQNKGRMLAHEGGMKGKIMPTVPLIPDGRIALMDNRYPITEFGIENLTMRLLERGRADTAINDCVVTYRDGAKVSGRPCRMMEVRRDVPKQGDAVNHGMNVFLARVFTDTELNVPIRYAAFDWPVVPGGTPPVVEEYTYHKMKVNVGLTDADFDPENPAYNL